MALNEVSQFLEDYKAASTQPDFNSDEFTASYQRGINRDRFQPETKESLARKGFVRQTAEALGGSVTGAAELWMRAIRAVDPKGGNDVIRDFATFGIDSIKNFVAKHPSLAPDNQVETGVRRWWVEGIRSLVPSLSAAIPGIIGGAVGGPIGSAVGGGVVSGAIFGLAEFDKFNEEVEDRIVELGLSEEEATLTRQQARTPAIYSALTESGLEAAANALQVATFGRFLPGKKMLKGLVSRPVKDLFTKAPKEAIKAGARQLALTTPVEVGTEFAQAALETKFRRDVGLTDLDSMGAGINALGPAFVTNLLFFGAGKSANAAQRWSIRNSLESAKVDPNKRAKAVKDIANVVRGMDDINAQEIADELELSGFAHINTGLGIDINTDLGMETTLLRIKEALQDGETTLSRTTKLQKALEKDLDGEGLSIQDRIPAFQMFEGLTKINEDFTELRDARKAEEKEKVSVPTSEADRIEQNAERIINKKAKGPERTKKVAPETIETTEKSAKKIEDVGQEATVEGTLKRRGRETDRQLVKKLQKEGKAPREIAAEVAGEVAVRKEREAQLAKLEKRKERPIPERVLKQAERIGEERRAKERKKNDIVLTEEQRDVVEEKGISPQAVVDKIRTQIGEDATKEEFDALLNSIEEAPVKKPRVKLSRDLEKSKPKFGFGAKGLFDVDFESDVDKALFIIAKQKPSKAEDKFLDFLKKQFPGESVTELKARGMKVRAKIKDAIRTGKTAEQVVTLGETEFSKQLIKKEVKVEEIRPIDKKQEAQVRKELKDPEITPEEKRDLQQILIDAGLPIEVAKKKVKPKVEKEAPALDVQPTKKGLQTVEDELKKKELRFINAGVRASEKARLKKEILALRKQQDDIRKTLGVEPVSVEKARKNIKEKLSVGTLRLGVDPTIAKDLTVVGTHHFKKGSTTFFKWAKDMLNDLGQGVKRFLRRIFNNVKQEQKLEQELAKPEPKKPKFKREPEPKKEFKVKDLGRKVTPEQQRIFETKLGPQMEGENISDKKERWTSNLKLKVQQGVVDQYASLKVLDERLWKLAQLTTTSSGAVETLLTQGPLTLTEGVPDIKDPKGGKGLFEILRPLGGELETFLGWIAGNRANNLLKEGKERNLTEDEIKELMALNEGEMKDGRSRKSVYRTVLRNFNVLHQSVLDVAVETGTINKEERETWDKDFYLPFFRFLDEKQEVRGPKTLGGISNQTAFKQLKGKDVPIADMLTNIILNWNHLVGASLKNQVAAKTVNLAVNERFPDGEPIATQLSVDMEVVELENGKFQVIIPTTGKNKGTFDTFEEAEEHIVQLQDIIARQLGKQKRNTVFVRENGKKVWYEINEPNIYQALTNLNFEGFNNRPMKAMRKFKRMLTFGVTASPEFKIRNLFRDTISSAATSKISLNLFDNVFGTGRKAVFGNSLSQMRMIAGGGNIMFGHLYGTDPEKLQAQLKSNLKKEGIIDNPSALKKLSSKVTGLIDKWNDLGSKMENLNRGALFSQTLEKEGFLEANFQARDLLDFNRHGAWPAVRFLIDVVPFMNARIQGLDKLGRGFSDAGQRKRLVAVMGGVAMAGMLLYLAYKDDDEFKEREDWDRDTYWWFKLPGSDNAIRLPKPFEIGAVGTMAERLLEQFVDDKAHGELFAERLGFALRETFAFGITPQVAKPVLELMANRNFFTDRPIETLSMQNLSPINRRKAWTSETAIGMSALFSKIPWDKVQLSPVQVEHLVQGYLGWVGATALGAVDQVFTQPIGGFPGRPSRRIEEFPLIGPFVRTTPSRQTKYATLFYEGLKEMNQTWADIRNFRTLGETEKALNLARKEKDNLRFRKLANKIQRRVAAVTKRIRLTRLSKKLSAREKRAKIDRLTVTKNKLLKMAVEKINP